MVRELTFTEQREIAEITARLECLADLEALVKLADDKTLTHAQKHHVLQTVIIKMERIQADMKAELTAIVDPASAIPF